MNPAFISAVSLVWIFLITADLVATLFYRDRDGYHFWSSFCFQPTICVCTFIESLDAVLRGYWIRVGLFSIYTVIMGWIWWNNDHNRRRRKRLRGKLAARIVVAGGRLKIVRPVTDG